MTDASPDLFTPRQMTGGELRDQALDRLERARAEYVARARIHADMIYARLGYCTVDLIRAECPPPSDIDGRVMGALLRAPAWLVEGDQHSRRGINHGKKIARFVKGDSNAF